MSTRSCYNFLIEYISGCCLWVLVSLDFFVHGFRILSHDLPLSMFLIIFQLVFFFVFFALEFILFPSCYGNLSFYVLFIVLPSSLFLSFSPSCPLPRYSRPIVIPHRRTTQRRLRGQTASAFFAILFVLPILSLFSFLVHLDTVRWSSVI